MDEELRDGLEIQEENVYADPVLEIEVENQPESILEQMEDGSWRHTENSPFSPFYVPDRKQQKNNRITIGLIGLLLLLLIVGMIFAVSKLVEAAMGEAQTAWKEGSTAIGEYWDEFKNEFNNEFEDEWQEGTPGTPLPDYIFPDNYGTEEWEDYFKNFDGFEEYDGDDYYYDGDVYVPSPDDEYYVELADSIRDDLSYSVTFDEYEVYDPDNNVDIWIEYAQVDGDIPAVDAINEYLEDGAMYYARYFDSVFATNVTLSAVTYVTYMDEEMLSVVVDERYSYENEQHFNLYCMNFDLTTGTLLYNTEMIEASEELAKAFRSQSDYQNGESIAVSQYTDKEIVDFMADEESLILYYTPVGLEVGYNYSDGWITATLKEYEEYLKRL